MPSDLFPVAMTFFRSVASLMLEHSRTSVQDNVILFSLKKKYLKVKKSEYIIILDFLGYFTIISSIQTYTRMACTKNMQRNCCTEEGFDSFLLWWWLIWHLVWKLLVSNDSWTSTNEPPTFFHPDWQFGNCSFFTVGLNKGSVLSVAHAIVFLANWISIQRVRKDKLSL